MVQRYHATVAEILRETPRRRTSVTVSPPRIDEAITVVLSLLPRREANSGGEDKGEGQEKICQLLFRRSQVRAVVLNLRSHR